VGAGPMCRWECVEVRMLFFFFFLCFIYFVVMGNAAMQNVLDKILIRVEIEDGGRKVFNSD